MIQCDEKIQYNANREEFEYQRLVIQEVIYDFYVAMSDLCKTEEQCNIMIHEVTLSENLLELWTKYHDKTRYKYDSEKMKNC